METITKEEIKTAISDFLDMKSKLTDAKNKLNKEQDALLKEQSKLKFDQKIIDKQLVKIESTKKEVEKYAEIRAVKYDTEMWIKNAAEKLTEQIKFGTHISKGIHPDSKGDNIYFKFQAELPDGLIGTQVLEKLELDANGNAAALPLVDFLNITVNNIPLKELILADAESLNGVFSSDEEKSREYFELFKNCLKNKLSAPQSYELNKQLLWPVDDAAIENDTYVCLIPLYPSSFTHGFYKTVHTKFYSEENINARKDRFKDQKESKPYLDQIELGYTKLGGTKPQNISKLTSSQGGRNYLLPSLPPVFDRTRQYTVPKNQTSIFGKQLYFYCRKYFDELFDIVKVPDCRNNVDIRNMRKETLALILHEIISFAAAIQSNWLPGWSKNEDYKYLNENEKFWLDPERGNLEGEDEFMEKRNSVDWLKDITEHFAHWINVLLRKSFEKQKQEFDKAEYLEWVREFEDVVKASLRRKEGVFV